MGEHLIRTHRTHLLTSKIILHALPRDLTTLLFFCGEHDVLFSGTIDTKTGRWSLRNGSRKIMRTSNRVATRFSEESPNNVKMRMHQCSHTQSRRALTTGTLVV